jgi:hypothetical protein
MIGSFRREVTPTNRPPAERRVQYAESQREFKRPRRAVADSANLADFRPAARL